MTTQQTPPTNTRRVRRARRRAMFAQYARRHGLCWTEAERLKMKLHMVKVRTVQASDGTLYERLRCGMLIFKGFVA